jgi:hypothetical protein
MTVIERDEVVSVGGEYKSQSQALVESPELWKRREQVRTKIFYLL